MPTSLDPRRSARIVGENGRSVVLSDPTPDGSGGWRYTVSVEFEAGRADVEVWDYGDPALPGLLRKAADNWRGFDAPIEFASVEGQFELTLTHDRKGTIECVATVRQPWPPAWATTIELSYGAGANADQVASDFEAVFASTDR